MDFVITEIWVARSGAKGSRVSSVRPLVLLLNLS